MKCDNCGKYNANIRYLRNINGVKQEMNLCEECAEKLGVTDISFNMPIDFSSFLGGFFEDFGKNDLLPLLNTTKQEKCKGCSSTFENILEKGKFGCEQCYSTFEDEIDALLNKLQGSNRHIGRIGKINSNKLENEGFEKRQYGNADRNGEGLNNKETDNSKNKNQIRINELKLKLKQLVKEENYEEAAKIRDEIKNLEKNK